MDHDYARRMMNLTSYGIAENQGEKITLLGSLRLFDEGVNEFRVELSTQAPMYGEWRPKFEANGNDFHVEVVSFGYADPYNVGNFHPCARAHLPQGAILRVQSLIKILFKDPEATKSIVPFAIAKATFAGDIIFRQGWVLEE